MTCTKFATVEIIILSGSHDNLAYNLHGHKL